jgi:Na+-transporting NADH:ubiquinone oxidoreductase subunit NqrC
MMQLVTVLCIIIIVALVCCFVCVSCVMLGKQNDTLRKELFDKKQQ